MLDERRTDNPAPPVTTMVRRRRIPSPVHPPNPLLSVGRKPLDRRPETVFPAVHRRPAGEAREFAVIHTQFLYLGPPQTGTLIGGAELFLTPMSAFLAKTVN